MLRRKQTEQFLRRTMVLILMAALVCAAGTAKVSAAETEAQLHAGPVLMVTDYEVIEGDRTPGSSFLLEMHIANLSRTAWAYDVVATLTVENLSVSLQEGVTNQLYFHEIAPMETIAVQFPMEVYTYSTEENMVLTMTMTCYDLLAVHYDFQTMMTPDIDVVRTLSIASLAVPQFVHQNSGMIISATLQNVEQVTLNNVQMHVVTRYGEEITEVGQLLREERKTVDSITRFPEQRTEDVKVYFTYESLYGEEFTTEAQSYQVVVYDPVEQEGFGDSGKLGVKAILSRLFYGIGIPGTEVRIPIPVILLVLGGLAGYGRVVYVALKKKEA